MHQSRAGATWALVRRQHGVIGRGQLLELGWSVDAIRHRIERGRLHPLWAGVYAVGRPEVTQHGRWTAAVLACGPGAVLSHHSAAELWGLLSPRALPVEISVAAGIRRHPGIAVHRRTAPVLANVTLRHGIPVTNVALTLTDIAACISRGRLEAAINEADTRDLTDPERLRALVEALPRVPGRGVMRRTLDRRTFRLTRSQLERRFRPIARRAGLPTPETRIRLNGYEVDFFWPGLGLVVETDGLRYHRTPAQQARDRERDQAHTASGLTALRFTHEQVAFEPGRVEAALSRVAVRLRGPGSPPPADA